jgi:eukaryotic-like serine/threonine-protein kinase
LELAPEAIPEWLAGLAVDTELSAALAVALRDAVGSDSVDRLKRMVAPTIALQWTGKSIAGYRIVRSLGEGGNAIVFLARREQQAFTQDVALKLLRRGIHDPFELQLFQREQRILARLEHAGIARLIDAGVSEDRAAYLVMEFVDGIPITHYCSKARLGIEARLSLFLQVCVAVGYAHRNLVVHRDIKPSNILVTSGGDVKLLDFGIAKLMGDVLDDTRTQDRRLTPKYAAPEQFQGLSFSTATDVYSLGVVLHELVTGLPPEKDASLALLPPSKRDLGDAPRSLGLELAPAALARRLGGDIDAILDTALRLEPHDRYPGAKELADDVQRHLEGSPVAARRGGILYLSQRWLRRHRYFAAAAVTVAIVMIAATLYSYFQSAKADAAAMEAMAEARRAAAARDFMFALLKETAPDSDLPIETTDGLLDIASTKAESLFSEQPQLLIEVLVRIGELQRLRGRLAEAHAPLDRAVEAADASQEIGDRLKLEATIARTRLLEDEGHYAEAYEGIEGALARVSASSADRQLILARLLRAELLDRLGHTDAAIQEAKETLANLRASVDADLKYQALTTLGDALASAGQNEKAIAVLRESVRVVRRHYGAAHAEYATALGVLSGPLRAIGKLKEAETVLREQLDVWRGMYSRPSQRVSVTLNDLGVTLYARGEYSEARQMFVRTLEMQKHVLAPDHPEIATTLGNLAALHLRDGELDAAQKLQREQLERTVRSRGEAHPSVGRIRRNLAVTMLRKGQNREAFAEMARALQIDEASRGADSLAAAYDHDVIADIARNSGNSEGEREERGRALEIYRKQVVPGQAQRVAATFRLAQLAEQHGDAAEAQALLREAYESVRLGQPLDSQALEAISAALVANLHARGLNQEAKRVAEETAVMTGAPSRR